MTISAQIIADSISPQGIRISTMQLRYPRFIHAEFMTHRVFSRNASSSRAIPVQRLIEDIKREPAMPIHWGATQPGMQAFHELPDSLKESAKWRWLNACDDAINHAQLIHNLGAHKQVVNRILEPFSHINVLVTSTSWKNFYALRRHPDAQPEIKMLADEMHGAMGSTYPRKLEPGEWHLPYIAAEDWSRASLWVGWGDRQTELNEQEVAGLLTKVSVARCARVSYLTHDMKKPNLDNDLKLYERLVGSVPLHASPAEHQATPDAQEFWPYSDGQGGKNMWSNPKLHGNFMGWIQYRKTLAGEYTAD